jgi:Holliday junction resolvase RusA-like endonuclease
VVNRIFFVVPGEPVPKARPRFTMQGGKARTYTPTSSAAYETIIGLLAHAAMRAQGIAEPMKGALHVQVQAFFPVPQSWSKKRKAAAQWHASRPDLDNVVKSALDGLNMVAFADDGQVASVYATKAYSDTPRLEVAVYEIGAENPHICSHKEQTQCGCRGSSGEAKNAPKREIGGKNGVCHECERRNYCCAEPGRCRKMRKGDDVDD